MGDALAWRQLEQALRIVRLSGQSGIPAVRVGRALHVGVDRAHRICAALDTAGLVDLGCGRGRARVVARPPGTVPEDVQMSAAVAVYVADEHQAKRDRLERIRGTADG